MADADLIESDVFERSQADGPVVSAATYNMVIGLVLCWGFVVNWLLVRHINPASLAAVNPWIFIIGYFASCIFGAYLFNSSKDPAISFLGYNFVVVPFGLVVNMIVSRYDTALVLQAIQITAAVTVVMMIGGSLFPQFFQRIHTALFFALIAIIIVESVQIFIFHIRQGWTDWVVVLIFCGYLGYDWGRANAIPKTVDNAIDSAASIYMDIINLFIRILSILGRRRS